MNRNKFIKGKIKKPVKIIEGPEIDHHTYTAKLCGQHTENYYEKMDERMLREKLVPITTEAIERAQKGYDYYTWIAPTIGLENAKQIPSLIHALKKRGYKVKVKDAEEPTNKKGAGGHCLTLTVTW